MPDVQESSPLEPGSPALSLLSLSIAAANATPIVLPHNHNNTHSPVAPAAANNSLHGTSSAVPQQGIPTTTAGPAPKQHRRLSSTGKARRRLSDARDAAARPSPAALHTNGLSLSTSLPTQTLSITSPSYIYPHANNTLPVARKTSSSSSDPPLTSSPLDETALNGNTIHRSNGETTFSNGGLSTTSNGAKTSRKKGMDHKCETCSKIYRHPSCLIKHRWEHTPHWREASKFVLSKHQQVQLLEAAAILSHLSPSSATGTSLPEDRSLWPSFLSGGALPPPSTSDTTTTTTHPISSSVPSPMSAMARAAPRLHDYAIPASAHASGGITQLRPGLLGVPTGPPGSTATTTGVITAATVAPVASPSRSRSPPPQPASKTATPPPPPPASVSVSSGSLPVPVPAGSSRSAAYRRRGSIGSSSESWWTSSHRHTNNSYSSHPAHGGPPRSLSLSVSSYAGWSLPRSSLRSVSRSRSRSGSSPGRSDDDDDEEEEEEEEEDSSEPMERDDDGELELDDKRARYAYAVREDEEMMRWGYDNSVREEDEEYEDARKDAGRIAEEEEAWDGMEMEMEMD